MNSFFSIFKKYLPVYMISTVLLIGLIAPYIVGDNVYKLNYKNRLKPPSYEHFFGTDVTGRDVFKRVILGTRITLKIAFSVILIALSIGILVGTFSGYYSGLIDNFLMWITNIFLSFPSIILALAINSALGPGLNSAILAVGLTMWPSYARILRTSILTLKNEEYILTARSLGASNFHIIIKHILPNSFSPIIIQSSLDIGYAILAVAGLSFLGIGAQPPISEWGFMVAEGQKSILSSWWWSTFPGIAICFAVISFNLFGEFLRDNLQKNI